jgi:beta-lactamase class C
MKSFKLIFIILITSVVINNCTESKSEVSEKKVIKKELPAYLKTFEDSIKATIEKEKIPGMAIAIVQDTSLLYRQAFGFADNDSAIAIDTNAVFRLASLSKGFSAVLTGILVEKGFLKWDDKITKYYPEFMLKDSAQADRVEIRHILSHSSGLPYHAYTNLIEDGLSLEKIIPRLAELDLIAKEGEVYAYQNAGFAIIEKVIEGATDSSFAVLLDKHIFKPLHMHNASTSYQDLVHANKLAKPHFFSAAEEKYVTIKNSDKFYNAVSAGGINASISDMAQWLQLLLGNRPDIISDSTLSDIFNPVVRVNTRRYSRRWGARRSEYAMGWRVVNFQGRNIVFHGGYVNAYRSEIAIDRKNKLGICVLFNAPNRYAGQIIPDFFSSFFNADSSKNMQ